MGYYMILSIVGTCWLSVLCMCVCVCVCVCARVRTCAHVHTVVSLIYRWRQW